MSDLGSIERSYGSVAEYNRSKEEADRGRGKKGQPEVTRKCEELLLQMNDEIYEKLSVPATDEARRVAEDYQNRVKDIDCRCSPGQETHNGLKHAAMQSIASQYGLKFSDKAPEPDEGQFYISYEYIENSMYHSKFSDPMDKDTFFKAYSDMYELDKGMTVKYRDTSGKEPDKWGGVQDMHHVSNSSLASIRWYDFKQWGVDDPEGASVIRNTRAEYNARINKIKADYERTRAINDMADDFCDGLSDPYDGYYCG